MKSHLQTLRGHEIESRSDYKWEIQERKGLDGSIERIPSRMLYKIEELFVL